jgi:hypothetical protein
MRARVLALSLSLALGATAPALAQTPPSGIGDATVVAVIDEQMNPYHWDFLASKMPQALDSDPSNDLPLDQPASTWLPGFPEATKLDITVPSSLQGKPDTLLAGDQAKWNTVEMSTADKPRVYWFPGMKIIGAMTFTGTRIADTGDQHGTGSASTAVGNLSGTCPECLLFYIGESDSESGEAAIEWAMKQPWIDVISNSYGYSFYQRDRLYSWSDTEKQRAASDRGQSIFFSAGNGVDAGFVAPNSTLFSSQEGPDWITTVGAVTQGDDNYYISPSDPYTAYSGAGKPADIAGVGEQYPNAYGAPTVRHFGNGFSGTSNATPQLAGTYARALYLARTALTGASRTQAAGVIATGDPIACGPARATCELGDGKLTAGELRTRLYEGATHTGKGYTVAGITDGLPVANDELEYLAVGHGYYAGRQSKFRDLFEAESDGLLDTMLGTIAPKARPDGEREWMIVDSYCRQKNWGSWTGGYYVDGKTVLPGPDAAFPLRSILQQTCPGGRTPLKNPFG